MLKSLICAVATLFSLACESASASDHFDRLAEAGGWQTYGLPTEGPAGYVEASPDGNETVSFDFGYDGGLKSFFISLQPIAAGGTGDRSLALKIVFANGDAFAFVSGKASDPRMMMPDSEIASWTHDLTFFDRMELTVEPQDQPGHLLETLSFNLTGTTPAVTALAEYLKSRDVTGLPKPFDFSGSVASRKRNGLDSTAVEMPSARILSHPIGSDATHQILTFRPSMSLFIENSLKPIVHGITNLPDETELIVTLSRPTTLYDAQDTVVVSRGQFTAGRFTSNDNPLNQGNYHVKVSMSYAELQRRDVQTVLGDHGQNMSGPLTLKDPATGETIFQYDTDYALGGAADSIADAAARRGNLEALRAWSVQQCSKDVDYVNSLVGEGALTGRQILGQERQDEVDACISEVNRRADRDH